MDGSWDKEAEDQVGAALLRTSALAFDVAEADNNVGVVVTAAARASYYDRNAAVVVVVGLSRPDQALGGRIAGPVEVVEVVEAHVRYDSFRPAKTPYGGKEGGLPLLVACFGRRPSGSMISRCFRFVAAAKRVAAAEVAAAAGAALGIPDLDTL